MKGSFQDQLLKLGLVNKQKLDSAKKEQHQQKKQKIGKHQAAPVDENKVLAEQALAKKQQRAMQLNQERENKLRRREEAAKIKQMIESNRLKKDNSGQPFRFVDHGKIFRLFVADEVAGQLSGGSAAIVRLGDQYEVVPTVVAEKLKEMDPALIVLLNVPAKAVKPASEDDPYAGFEVPDDLVW